MGAPDFGASLFGREHPIDAGAFGIAPLLPCGGFCDKPHIAFDTPVEALAGPEAHLHFDPVSPAGVLWGVMEFGVAQRPPRFGSRGCLIKPRGRLGWQGV